MRLFYHKKMKKEKAPGILPVTFSFSLVLMQEHLGLLLSFSALFGGLLLLL